MTNEFKAKCSSVIKNGLGVEHNIEFLKGFDLVLNQEGPFFDIGCWKGTLSFLAALYLKHKNIKKHIFLFDTFDGHPVNKKTKQDETWPCKIEDFRAVSIQSIRDTFKQIDFSDYSIIEGDIEQTLKQVNLSPSFASLDLNYYQSTKIALQFLQKKHFDYTILWEDDLNHIYGVTQAYKEFESELLEIHCNQTRGGFFKFLKYEK